MAKKKTVSKKKNDQSVSLAKWESLAWADLEQWAGSRSVTRGRSYQRQGRVEDLGIKSDDSILATVEGSTEYYVQIHCTKAGKKASLDSTCSCPVGTNCNVTQNPTMEWTFQQIREAFPFNKAPRYLLHDNGSVFSRKFCNRLKSLGIESIRIAYCSPWQSPYVERVNGTLRRECLDHLIILNERHLRRILSEFIDDYYHTTRPYLSLNRNAPIPRNIDQPSNGKIVSTPTLGGLHHRYRRVA
jgi:hypothetical protein